MMVWTAPARAEVSQKDLKCLTDNIYWEAQGESVKGMIWVGHSVIERMKDSRWESTVCDVVYEPKQYSWTLEAPRSIKYPMEYHLAQGIATAILEGRTEAPSINHYLRCDWKGKVRWWRSMTFVGNIGNHCFYYDKP